MPENQSNWKDLGEETKNLIQDAISSGNFDHLSRDVSSIANRAVKNFTQQANSYQEVSRNRRAYEQQFYENRGYQRKPYEQQFYNAKAQQGPNRRAYRQTVEQVQYPAVYESKYKNTTSTKLVSVILMSVFGFLGLLLFMIFGSIAIATTGIAKLVMGVLCLLPAGFLTAAGISCRYLVRAGRYDGYVNAIGSRDYIEVKRLSQIVGKSEKFINKDLKKFITGGWFKQGHLDDTGTTLMLTDKAYQEYTKIKQEREKNERELEELKRESEKNNSKYTEYQRDIFKKGDEYIKEIHRCNDEIPGEEMSAKIDRMEHSVGMIIDRAKQEPRLCEDLRRLMNYYLPTTVKLLNAYADLDKQQKNSDNIEKSKREIEDTIDTLNDAFDKFFDDMFVDESLDISTDATVMKNMLKQEGLV